MSLITKKTKRKYNKKIKKTNKRLTFLKIFMVLIFSVAFSRLLYLQIFKFNDYTAQADNQHTFFENLVPERGKIFAKDKFSDHLFPLATNEKYYFVYAIPRDIENVEEAFDKIDNILKFTDEEKEQIKERLSKKEDEDLYEPIKHEITKEQKERLEELDLKGLSFIPEKKRIYPENKLASHIIGFSSKKEDFKQIGQYGIEEYYQSKIEGKPGYFEAFLDTKGNWITSSKRKEEPAINGDDLVLTIDHTLQFIVEEKLREGIEKYEAEAGEIIIQDPQTGAILAMASFPDFDPNKYEEIDEIKNFINRNTQYTYEPGSVIKAFTAAAAIDTGVAEPDTTYLDSGSISLNNFTITNVDGKAHGVKTLTQMLEESLNIGSIHFGKLVGKDNFKKYFESFGFSEETGIDLAGETQGNLSNLENKKSDVNYATTTFGQGMTVTPLGLINGFSSLVNGGNLMRPYMVSEIHQTNGEIVKTEPQVIREVIKPSSSLKLKAMLVSVVKNGHAKTAQVPGYEVGGKTGTANIPVKGVYTDHTNHTFLGFGPVDNPRFTILVRYERPKTVTYSVGSAAPTFQELATYLFSYLEISPTNPEELENKDKEQ